jgi:hypothetical protein
MNSKRLKALLGLYTLIVISALVNGCCKGEYRLTGFDYVTATETVIEPDSTVRYMDITKVTGEFRITANLQMEMASNNNLSLMNSSYALSCDYPTINPIAENSITISMDRGFVLNGDSIPPNTNLLIYNNSGIIKESYIDRYSNRGPLEFVFTEDFFTNSILANGDYVFTIIALTEEGVKFESDIELEFDL